MVDVHTREQRSRNMSSIRSKDTIPELRVRSALHKAGYRFRLHRKDIPGNPDVAMCGRKLAIFVHGCFWHRHPGCKYAYTPKSRIDFWRKKFDTNIARDQVVAEELIKKGWKQLVIWECETKDQSNIVNIVKDFLGDKEKRISG